MSYKRSIEVFAFQKEEEERTTNMGLNMETIGQFKLYSITQAAREMHIGKDALYRLIYEGKIGVIKIGKREKIPAMEIEKFQSENLSRRMPESKAAMASIPQPIRTSKSLFRALRQEILKGKPL